MARKTTYLTYPYASTSENKLRLIYVSQWFIDWSPFAVIFLIGYIELLRGTLFKDYVESFVLMFVGYWVVKGPLMWSIDKIQVTKDYLILDGHIVYLRTISNVSINKQEGRCTVNCPSGRRYVIERERFKSNARKDNKISANQARMFNKFTDKLSQYHKAMKNPPTTATR